MTPPDGNPPDTRTDHADRCPGAPPGAAKDHVGMWYVARARHGIDDSIWFGLATRDADGREHLRWITCAHRHADGIGALSRLLAVRGYTGGDWPTCRETAPPPAGALLAGWRRRPAGTARGEWPAWRDLDPQRAGLPHDRPPACTFLDDDAHRAVAAAARGAGASLTTWLLWTADRATRRVLARPDAALPWVFPVNLRGAVRLADPGMNHCTGLGIVLDGDATPASLAAQVQARFAAGEHWRQWWLLTLGRFIGQRGVNLLYDLAAGRPGSHAGSYSNLGRWPLPGMSLPPDPPGGTVTGVVCSAPGSPAYPVSVGTVDWQGRLSLSCRVHPAVAADPAAAGAALLAAWVSLATGD